MKRSILFIVLGLIAWAAFASDESDFYTEQFNNAFTAVEQLNVLRVVRDANIADADVFYASALKRILWVYPNIKGTKELDAADESIRLITDQLSDAQVDTGPDLWRVVQTFSNPLVRSDALIALGKVKNADLLPQVVQLLKDTNSSPYINRLSGERIAFGAIEALAGYDESVGYLPVFFAANGWYSDWLRKRANDVLANFSTDPAEPLKEVIHSASYTYADKYLALKAVEKSDKIDDSAKAEIAAAALYEGWRGKGFMSDPRMQKELVQMRKYAIGMVSLYKASDDSVYPLLERSYQYGIDEDEQIKVISALQNIATDEAANLLSVFIGITNDKLERGILTPRDERLMRALVPALGKTIKTDAAEKVLRHVVVLDWSYSIKQLASQAMTDLGM